MILDCFQWGCSLVKVNVGVKTSSAETKRALKVLEEVGRVTQVGVMDELLGGIPKEILDNKEYVARFLLLTAILDQQAESPTARKAARFILDTYGRSLFDDPIKVMIDFEKMEPLDSEKIYVISPAIGRATSRFAWITLRVGGFLIYELKLNSERMSLYERFSNYESPNEALSFLYSSSLLKNLLRDKAARMYISWIGHPDFGIDISGGRWKVADFLMLVNGHVGKVFSRAGMVDEVIVETVREGSERKDIIKASEMREQIEQIVKSYGLDRVRVDHGAFVIGINCCADNFKEAKCESCDKPQCNVKEKIKCEGYCILKDFCKKNKRWHAY